MPTTSISVIPPEIIISKWNRNTFYVLWDFSLFPIDPITEIAVNFRNSFVKEKDENGKKTHLIQFSPCDVELGNAFNQKERSLRKYMVDVNCAVYDKMAVRPSETEIQTAFAKEVDEFIWRLAKYIQEWVEAPDGYAATIGTDVKTAHKLIDDFCVRINIRKAKKTDAEKREARRRYAISHSQSTQSDAPQELITDAIIGHA